MSFSLTFFKCVVEFSNQTLNSVVFIMEINSIQLHLIKLNLRFSHFNCKKVTVKLLLVKKISKKKILLKIH